MKNPNLIQAENLLTVIKSRGWKPHSEVKKAIEEAGRYTFVPRDLRDFSGIAAEIFYDLVVRASEPPPGLSPRRKVGNNV